MTTVYKKKGERRDNCAGSEFLYQKGEGRTSMKETEGEDPKGCQTP